ncbi:polysaccharide biosynthesis/export family protein [Sphaerochaeta sp. PS]|uniref:polysaccharide biosynthesis/export family protein n=1 Tax=Sphaerochaeta sp. PS TaxID=3076336 RepID=UPI0028A44167|nr:polysaccharide biosynthesis/export family protein [Sphaerochaeta sp. PS]MDT4762337.1 polysaccharide biosynthesis/export family protein [Sphaerochaeta sp. PS]
MNTIARKCSILSLLLLISTLLFAADGAGLVVRSSLFGPEALPSSPSLKSLSLQSYSDQLGLESAQGEESAESRVLRAISNAAYPVTPGDTFRLVYLDGLKTITVDLQVDEKGSVTIPGLGTIQCSGLTFSQVKQEILTMVQTYHSYSNPLLILTGTGAFSVSVVGEVGATRVVPVWGLSRLSSVVYGATAYASTRAISIQGSDGSTHTYDLYLALRKGVLDQDPLLKSGDIITIPRSAKTVVLAGNVYSPGTYQLKAGEGLKELVSYYGGGVLSQADVQKIRVQRYNVKNGGWEMQYVDLFSGKEEGLQHLDQVIVDTVAPSVRTVTIEGAVAASEVYDSLSSTALVGTSSGRIFYQFYPGESVRQMLQTISARLMTVSDLDGTYLLRDQKKIPLKAQQILYAQDPNADLVLENGDTFIIPFTQRFVSVSGAVVRSGVFAYVPDKGANYYLALAGGLSDDASVPTSVKVYGPNGEKLDSGGVIPPESTIRIAKNTFIKDIAPTVAVIGLVSSILGIVAVVISAIVDSKSL